MQSTAAEAQTAIRLKLSGYDLVRALLGSLLLIAALLKGHQLATEPVLESDLLSSRAVLIGVVEFELALGLWLLSGVQPRLCWGVSTICFATFAAIGLYKLLSGAESCGCFGRVRIHPGYTFFIDLAAVAALLVFRPRMDPSAAVRYPRLRLAVAAGLCCLIGIPGAIAMATYRPARVSEQGDIFGDSAFVVLEPQQWIGQPFPLQKYLETDAQLNSGDWLAVFYHHDCPMCQEVLPKYRTMAEDLAAYESELQILLIDVPPHGAHAPFSTAASDFIRFAKLSASKEWFIVTPSAALLSFGKVRAAWEKSVPTELEPIKEYLQIAPARLE